MMLLESWQQWVNLNFQNSYVYNASKKKKWHLVSMILIWKINTLRGHSLFHLVEEWKHTFTFSASHLTETNLRVKGIYFCICHFVWIEHHWRLPQHGWHRLSGWVLRINVSLTLIVAVWVWILPLIASSRNLSRCARIQSFHCQRLLHKNKNCLLSFLATILSCIFCVSLLLNPNY